MPAGIRHRARLNQNRRIRLQTRSSSFKSELVACGSRGRGASRQTGMRWCPSRSASASWQSSRRLRLRARRLPRVPCRSTW
eukprot:6503472-Alexandrium_andersonii.AAC.1